MLSHLPSTFEKTYVPKLTHLKGHDVSASKVCYQVLKDVGLDIDCPAMNATTTWFDWKHLILRRKIDISRVAALRVWVRARHLGVRGQRWGKPHQVLSANHLPSKIFPQTGGSQFVSFSFNESMGQRPSVRP